MSKKPFKTFLGLSVGGHVLLFAFLMFLAKPSDEIIYDSIEFTVQPSTAQASSAQPSAVQKSLSQHPAVPQISSERPTDVADFAEQSADQKNESLSGSSSDGALTSEKIATWSEITTPVRLISSIKANRTDAARRADYSGISIVELVVGSNGSVLQAKLMNQLDYGLNDVALDIARKLKFKPAMIGSKTVATKVNLKIKFTSKD